VGTSRPDARAAKRPAPRPEAAAPAEADAPLGPADPTAYNVQLPAFEGPLDLLLHLVQSHQLDIFDIPVHFITEKYLEYLTLMQHLAIDVASEYLVMAAVLAHIKSKMLLPEPPADQADELAGEELDPREELVRRLLEYQKYKDAAARLAALGAAGQDALPRPPAEAAAQGPAPFAEVPVFHLLDAFAKLLSRRKVRVDHEITFDRLSITDRIHELTAVFRARAARRLPFEALFGERASRFDLVITFLALLEMSRLRMTRLFQTEALSPLEVEFTAELDGAGRPSPGDGDATRGAPGGEAQAPPRGEGERRPDETGEARAGGGGPLPPGDGGQGAAGDGGERPAAEGGQGAAGDGGERPPAGEGR
jgi:segregation and condensation protein A